MTAQTHCPFCSLPRRRIILTTDGMDLVKCRGCGLIYLKDVPDERVLYEDYHECTGFDPGDYSVNSVHPNLKALWHINQQRIEVITRHRNSGALLDMGCGSGAFMLTAKKAGFDVFGIDVSEKAARFAREELNLNVTSKNINELTGQFNVITLWHVLEHFLNPVAELVKIHNKLCTDGVLIGEVPNWNSIKFQLSGKKWKGGNHPLYHRSFFSSQTLRKTILKAGFSKCKLIHLPYTSSGKKGPYHFLKKAFNSIHRDAFLAFAAWK